MVIKYFRNPAVESWCKRTALTRGPTSYLLIKPEIFYFPVPHSTMGQWFSVMSRRGPQLPSNRLQAAAVVAGGDGRNSEGC